MKPRQNPAPAAPIVAPDANRCTHPDGCGFPRAPGAARCGLPTHQLPVAPAPQTPAQAVPTLLQQRTAARVEMLRRSAERPGMLTWILDGPGCPLCDENDAASPIADDEDWPNPGPPCHSSCECEIEWSPLEGEDDPAPDAAIGVDDVSAALEDMMSGLTEDEEAAAKEYAVNSMIVNGGLRQLSEDEFAVQYPKEAAIARDLASSMRETPDGVVVYRAIPGSRLGGELGIGDTVTDKAFMSTSADIAQAGKFAATREGADRVVFHIEVPPGTKGVWMRGVPGTYNAHEAELLLDKSATLRVIGVRDEKVPNPAGKAVMCRIYHMAVQP